MFTAQKVAVYVDGCFWHGCLEHAKEPKNNAVWWRNKLGANRTRDARTNTDLTNEGWRVIRIWEHESTETAADQIAAAVDAAR